MSAGSLPRYPSSSGLPLISLIICRASRSLIGTTRNATSFRISTITPPSPNISTGPNCGSFVMPMITSMPCFSMRCIATPSIVASGTCCFAEATIRSNAAATSPAEARFSTTPPTSDLCVICGDTIFSTIGYPSVSAIFAASSFVVASRAGETGTPASSSTCLASISVSSVRPSLRAPSMIADGMCRSPESGRRPLTGRRRSKSTPQGEVAEARARRKPRDEETDGRHTSSRIRGWVPALTSIEYSEVDWLILCEPGCTLGAMFKAYGSPLRAIAP